MVPPLNRFQGKNKNCSSLARTISASRRSFFANLTIGPEKMPILDLGQLRRPQLKWDQPKTYKFWQSPHFQNRDFEKRNFFSPERRSKVVKFTKNDRLDALIVLARDERFSFFPWKWSKGGTIGQFFPHLYYLASIYLLIPSSPHDMSIHGKWPSDQTFNLVGI